MKLEWLDIGEIRIEDGEAVADVASNHAQIGEQLVERYNSFDALTEANKKLREALVDARMRFANLADGIYAGIGHNNEPISWMRDAQQGRDAIDAALKVTP